METKFKDTVGLDTAKRDKKKIMLVMHIYSTYVNT